MLEKFTEEFVSQVQKRGYYHDGGGLYLSVTSRGTKSWIFRYRLACKLHDMGLGSAQYVGLQEAREKARECRKLLLNGIDPIEETRRIKETHAALRKVRARSKLLSVLDVLKSPAPTCGIYFWFKSGALQYIGQSTDIYYRISQHKRIPFDEWRLIPAAAQDLDRIEGAYIHAYSPPYNRSIIRRRANAAAGELHGEFARPSWDYPDNLPVTVRMFAAAVQFLSRGARSA